MKKLPAFKPQATVAVPLPPATVAVPVRERDASMQVYVPQATMRSLKLMAAERGVTMREVVLAALHAYGLDVPVDDLRDRRRT